MLAEDIILQRKADGKTLDVFSFLDLLMNYGHRLPSPDLSCMVILDIIIAGKLKQKFRQLGVVDFLSSWNHNRASS